MVKMLRQALKVTSDELRKLADELDSETSHVGDPLYYTIKGVVFQVNIINKTPKCSDTWEIEK